MQYSRCVARLVVVLIAFSSLIYQTPFVHAQQTDRGAKLLEDSPLPARLYDNVHALCIGIDKYRSPGIGELEWAEKDAEDVARVLEEVYGYQVTRLLGRAARKRAIESAIDEYSTTLGPNDALLVFFAGHGQTVELESFGRAGFLLPVDANLDIDDTRDPQEWQDMAINMRDLGDKIEKMNARHVLFIADACYSGFLGKRSVYGHRVDLQELVRRRSRMVITAGTEEQQSLEDSALQHGMFTHVLLQQLNDGWAMSATELFTSLRRGVARLSEGRMLPQLREVVIDNGEFVFLPKEVKTDEVSDVILDVNSRINQRIARQTTLEDVYACLTASNYRFAVDAPGKQREWEGRFKRFSDNAALGDPLAMVGLYNCHARGLGTETNPDEAYEWARRAHDSDHPMGLHVLAECYLHGHGVVRNLVEAQNLFEAAWAQGVALSRVSLDIGYMERGSPSEKTAAFASLLSLQERDDCPPIVHHWIGLVLTGAVAVPESEINHDSGISHLTIAANAEVADSAFQLYTAHFTNYLTEFQSGNEPDPAALKDAAKWLEVAATRGHAHAQAVLANELFQMGGSSVTYNDYFPRPHLAYQPNHSKAYSWAELAATNGDPLGQVLAARMCLYGAGTEKDAIRGLRFLDQAVDQGAGIGYAHKALWLVLGLAGLEADIPLAMEHFRKASTFEPRYKFILARWYWRLYKVWPSGTNLEFGTPHPLVTDDREAVLNARQALQLFDQAASHGDRNSLAFLLLQTDHGLMSDFYGVSFPVIRQAFIDPDVSFNLARHLEMAYIPRATEVMHENSKQDVAESQIMVDEPEYGWFALWMYERAAIQGHKQAAEILDGDRGQWWFQRGERYQTFNMPIEAYWSFERAAAYGHKDASSRLDSLGREHPEAKKKYENGGLAGRWRRRDETQHRCWKNSAFRIAELQMYGTFESTT